MLKRSDGKQRLKKEYHQQRLAHKSNKTISLLSFSNLHKAILEIKNKEEEKLTTVKKQPAKDFYKSEGMIKIMNRCQNAL